MCSMQLVIGFQTYVVGYTELWIMWNTNTLIERE